MFKHNIVSAFFQYNLLEDHLFWNFLCSSSLFKIYFLVFICDILHHLSYYIYIFFSSWSSLQNSPTSDFFPPSQSDVFSDQDIISFPEISTWFFTIFLLPSLKIFWWYQLMLVQIFTRLLLLHFFDFRSFHHFSIINTYVFCIYFRQIFCITNTFHHISSLLQYSLKLSFPLIRIYIVSFLLHILLVYSLDFSLRICIFSMHFVTHYLQQFQLKISFFLAFFLVKESDYWNQLSSLPTWQH